MACWAGYMIPQPPPTFQSTAAWLCFGTADESSPYIAGGGTNDPELLNAGYVGAVESLNKWRDANGCSGSPVETWRRYAPGVVTRVRHPRPCIAALLRRGREARGSRGLLGFASMRPRRLSAPPSPPARHASSRHSSPQWQRLHHELHSVCRWEGGGARHPQRRGPLPLCGAADAGALGEGTWVEAVITPTASAPTQCRSASPLRRPHADTTL